MRFLILLFILKVSAADAAKCSSMLSPPADVQIPNEITNLIFYENVLNHEFHQQGRDLGTEARRIEYVGVDIESAKIRVSPLMNKKVQAALISDDLKIKWMRHHESKRSTKVPHSMDSPSGHLYGYSSASRSIFFYENGSFFSVKMPALQGFKHDLTKSVIISSRRAELVSEADLLIGKADNLIVLTDEMTVSDKKTGNGFVVRDLSKLQDGNRTVPGFSIPYLFEKFQISKSHSESQKQAAIEYTGEILGRGFADLLLRYGLYHKDPHVQNFLIRFKDDWTPYRRQIVWRDMSDTSIVEPIARAIGLSKFVENDIASGYKVLDKIKLPELSWGPYTLYAKEAFFRYVVQALNLQLDSSLRENHQIILDFMTSPAGVQRIKRYRDRAAIND